MDWVVTVLWMELVGVVDRFGSSEFSVSSARNSRKAPAGITLERTIRFIPATWIREGE